ncbi:STAS domain-containing protein [Halomonas caseinilytica]|uniref:Phospholipid transport system transporter-binding protein n=1 Tax=Halomonas caseinilytica TaxID=438744 RepID=A0A1M6X3W2_9GAMM|nr:STAS domain-containing protein [Halomonas caseinilytica]SEM74618.1 phospholipid transport system transporter-binding protein [Halomonas caseinilytica]SHL00697.1 phospholipid transport system transporter-binding protein [Halomonas caseinilytica]
MSVLLEDGANRLEAADDTLTVVGSVDFEGAAALAEAGRHWLEGRGHGERVAFDLQGVDRVSSAAISVLLEWLRQARQASVEVVDVRLSAPLASLTEVAELDSLLPAASPAAASV